MNKAKLLLTLCLSLLCILSSRAQIMQKVQVKKPGTLETEVTALGLTTPLTKLKVEGGLNGKDIAYLRQLSGGMFNLSIPQESDATLTYLDLKKATFVKDDERYCFLEDAYPNPTSIAKKMFAGCIKLETIVLPKTITSIEEEAFAFCSQLYEVRNIDNIKEVGWGAFKGCSSLQIVNFSDELTVIRGEAFKNCSDLQGMIFPSSLADIGSNAFESCGFRSVVLPSKAIDLGSYIFKSCPNLQNAWIEAPLQSIPAGIFSGCSQLHRIHLPENINIISSEAFTECSALRHIELPPYCGLIMGYSFWNCKNLKQITLSGEEITQAMGAFTENLLPSINVYVPQTLVQQYQQSEPWSKTSVLSWEDYAPTDNDIFEEDFDNYPDKLDEWQGNDIWKTEGGAYIRTVGSKRLLKLGDNEGVGIVRTKPLALQGNTGKFHIKFKADTWNDLHNNFIIAVYNKNDELTYSTPVTVPNPEMGNNLRQFDIELLGGTNEGYIKLYTTQEGRIAFIDDIHIYTTTKASPYYTASAQEINFGRINANEEVPDKVCFIYGENLSKAPKVKIVSKQLGVFSVDVEGDEKMSRVLIMLNTENIGVFEAYLKIEYNEENVIHIPLKAIIQNPTNPHNLDDTQPRTELDETFDTQARIPAGWSNILLEGNRKWMMRTTGGINANRYPAIDALGDAKGKIHALLVLPAIDFSSETLREKSLFFNLATVQANGATLRLVDLAKDGTITPLQDLTQTTDSEWQQIEYKLEQIAEKGIRFLAFEYIGEEKVKSTIYRIDNVKLDKSITCVEQLSNNNITIEVKGKTIYLKGGCHDEIVRFITTDGRTIAQQQAQDGYITFTAPSHGVYIIITKGKTLKVLVQ